MLQEKYVATAPTLVTNLI